MPQDSDLPLQTGENSAACRPSPLAAAKGAWWEFSPWFVFFHGQMRLTRKHLHFYSCYYIILATGTQEKD
jgi:hypothetical protein